VFIENLFESSDVHGLLVFLKNLSNLHFEDCQSLFFGLLASEFFFNELVVTLVEFGNFDLSGLFLLIIFMVCFLRGFGLIFVDIIRMLAW